MDYKQKFKYDVALLNNYYRQNKKSMSGKAVLLLMWDVGDLITKCCKKLNVKPKFFYTGGKSGWIGDQPFVFLKTKKN